MILVVCDALTDLATQAVNCKVHSGQLDGFALFLLPRHKHAGVGTLRFELLAVLFNKLSRLHEHTARTAGRVEDCAAVGLDDLNHEADDRARGEELATTLTFSKRKLAEEILVDLSEHIAGRIIRNVVELPEQIEWQRLHLLCAGEPVVLVFRQAAFEFGLVLLDRLHHLFECLGDVLILGEVQQVAVAGVFGQIEAALGNGDLIKRLLAPGPLQLVELSLDLDLEASVVDVCKLEEDEAENGGAVFRSLEIRISPEVVGSRSEVVFELLELLSIHLLSHKYSRRLFGAGMPNAQSHWWLGIDLLHECGAITIINGDLPRKPPRP